MFYTVIVNVHNHNFKVISKGFSWDMVVAVNILLYPFFPVKFSETVFNLTLTVSISLIYIMIKNHTLRLFFKSHASKNIF